MSELEVAVEEEAQHSTQGKREHPDRSREVSALQPNTLGVEQEGKKGEERDEGTEQAGAGQNDAMQCRKHEVLGLPQSSHAPVEVARRRGHEDGL